MDWWKKRKEKKEEKKKKDEEKEERGLLSRERGADLLEDIIKCCDGQSNPITFLSADLILKATNNFSESNRISKIPYSDWDWYSGIDDNNRMILIKRMTYYMGNRLGRDIAMSSMVSGHKNFMKLAGCCIELKYPVIVYYADNKTYSLIDLENIGSWKRRMKIAEDIATALAYLHTAFSTPFAYWNMNIENILIDEDGVAKVTDLTFCISIPLGKTFVEVERPNNVIEGDGQDLTTIHIVSQKSDAYEFGLFILVLLTGKHKRQHEFVGDNWLDPKWLSNFIQENMGEVTEEDHCRISALLLLAMRCARRPKREVPTMVEVAKELKKIQTYPQNASFHSTISPT